MAVDATTAELNAPGGDVGRVSGVFRLMGLNNRRSGARRRPAKPWGWASSKARRPAYALDQQAAAPAVVSARRRRSRARHGGRFSRAEGRRQALFGAHQALEEDPLASPSSRTPARRGRRAGRDAPPGRRGAAHRDVRRGGQDPRAAGPLQGDDPRRSQSAAGTRSSRAATASSATWCSTSSRCRAAPASCSMRRSPAARCRATTFRRSRRA